MIKKDKRAKIKHKIINGRWTIFQWPLQSVVSVCKLTLVDVIKIRMIQCIFRRDSFYWIIDQHLFDQIDTVLWDFCAEFIKLLPSPFGEGGFEVFKFGDVFPQVFVGSSHGLEDLEDLIDLRVSTEEDSLVCDFKENASHRPDINSWIVNFSSKQNFRCTIPEGDDFMGILLDGIVVGPCQSKICQLDVESFSTIDQNVLRLEIAMDDSIGVTELQR